MIVGASLRAARLRRAGAHPSPALLFILGLPMLQDRFIRRRSFRRRRGNLFAHRVWLLAMAVGGILAAAIFVLKEW
jgi:hypothetical protein